MPRRAWRDSESKREREGVGRKLRGDPPGSGPDWRGEQRLLTHEAASNGGTLAEWYGERTIHGLFGGLIWPDGYAVLALPDQPAIHFLLELDRATEPVVQLRNKAKRYARAIPRSTLARQHPVVVLAVPNPARAPAANDATTGTGASITAVVWNKDTRFIPTTRDRRFDR